MTSPSGLPSAHPAVYVPVTLVEVPRDQLRAAGVSAPTPGVAARPHPNRPHTHSPHPHRPYPHRPHPHRPYPHRPHPNRPYPHPDLAGPGRLRSARFAAPVRTVRPATVTAAGIVWGMLAAADAAVAIVVLATGAAPVPVGLLALALGVATAVPAVLLLGGWDTRIAVTVLGGLAGVVVLPALLLFLPGLVLTLHPSSTAWFER